MSTSSDRHKGDGTNRKKTAGKMRFFAAARGERKSQFSLPKRLLHLGHILVGDEHEAPLVQQKMQVY